MKPAKKLPAQHAIGVKGEPGQEITLTLSGRLALDNLSALQAELQSRLEQLRPAGLTVDLAGLEYLDSAGALALIQLQGESQARAIPCRLLNLSEEARRILDLIDPETLTRPPLIPEERVTGFMDQLGEASIRFASDLVQVITFLGDLLTSLWYVLLHPRSVRWGDVLFYMKRAGVDGLPIIGLIGLLLGLILAFMSSLQLKQFGANIYVASLLAVAMVQELGPIMTAILVAGRSGSAFAAEIGTMKVNEEVDALVTMGFDPVRFLAIPKVLASMLVVPLLTVYATLFGLLGGLIIGVLGLDLTVYSYVTESQRAIELFDILSSLVKSVVFALLVAGIGCQRGFQVRGGAEAVGSATTSAVVAGIFLIIVTDSAFALVLHYIR
ncbi:MAG: MlaE family lipid ABC transporter permease subunit [Deltaproteobacteria bacterium]|nr:MlaE family lipid ABC transporter permease subunit [Deltaproteobacteria bacterium]